MDSGDYALIVAFIAIAGNFALGMYSFINVKRLRSRVNFLTGDKILPVVIRKEHSSSSIRSTRSTHDNDEEKVVVEVENDRSEFHDVDLDEEKNPTEGKRYSLWPLY